jgi:hypothetical protein
VYHDPVTGDEAAVGIAEAGGLLLGAPDLREVRLDLAPRTARQSLYGRYEEPEEVRRTTVLMTTYEPAREESNG